MRLILLLAFILFPLIELVILIKLGSIFGFWPAFGLVVITAIAGTTVLRHQGFSVLKQMQDSVAIGRPPIEPVVNGVMFLAAGLLLISPGLITDLMGVLLLIPPVRRFLARSAFKRVFGPLMTSEGGRPGRTPSNAPNSASKPVPRRDGQGPIIDADYERLD
jgi:UPF0716 protein FxsA